jgi:hypothetical protein
LATISFDSEQFQFGKHVRKMIAVPFCIYVHSAFLHVKLCDISGYFWLLFHLILSNFILNLVYPLVLFCWKKTIFAELFCMLFMSSRAGL